MYGNSLAVQWLGLSAFTAAAQIQSWKWELRSHEMCGKAKNKRPHEISILKHIQINIYMCICERQYTCKQIRKKEGSAMSKLNYFVYKFSPQFPNSLTSLRWGHWSHFQIFFPGILILILTSAFVYFSSNSNQQLPCSPYHN